MTQLKGMKIYFQDRVQIMEKNNHLLCGLNFVKRSIMKGVINRHKDNLIGFI